jgi:hypothetical protein
MIESVRKSDGGFGIYYLGYLELGVGGIGGRILDLSQFWYRPRKLGLTGK